MNSSFGFFLVSPIRKVKFRPARRAPLASMEDLSPDDLKSHISVEYNDQAEIEHLNDIDPPLPMPYIVLHEDAKSTKQINLNTPNELVGKVYRSAKQNDRELRSHFTISQKMNVLGHRLRDGFRSIDCRRFFFHFACLIVVILCLAAIYYGFDFFFKPRDKPLPILHCFIPKTHVGKRGFKVQMNFSLKKNITDYPPFLYVTLRSPDSLIYISGQVTHVGKAVYKGLVEGYANLTINRNISFFHLVRYVFAEIKHKGFILLEEIEYETVLLNCDFNVVPPVRFEHINFFGDIYDL